MHIFKSSTSYKDKNGRLHISSKGMTELYTTFHQSLTDTYYETASNHKICTDAIDTLRSLHISKKNGEFLHNFTALIREVFSHAHYNVQELLLYNEKNSVRLAYWQDISNYYSLIMEKADKLWPHACVEKLLIMLQFSALFSLYKDVADEEFIFSLFNNAVDIMNSPIHKHTTPAEIIQMKDIFEQLQLVHRLRHEVQGVSLARKKISELSTAPKTEIFHEIHQTRVGKHSESRLATKEDLDDFFDRIMIEQEKEKKERKRGSSTSYSSNEMNTRKEEKPEKDEENDMNSYDDLATTNQQPIVERKRGLSSPPPFSIFLIDKETEKEDDFPDFEPKVEKSSAEEVQPVGIVPSLPELKRALRSLNTVKREDKKEEGAVELPAYDFKADFERRLAKKKIPVVFDAPIIPKPNPLDRVSSYRRPGLFNNVHSKVRTTVEIGESSTDTKMKNNESEKIEQQNASHSNEEIPTCPESPRTIEKNIIQSVLNSKPVSLEVT